MSTFAALTGAPVVPTTFHVKAWSPEVRVSPPLGEVTANGPEVVVEVTVMSAAPMRPPVALLSRIVTRKFIVRSVIGSVSPTDGVPLTRSFKFGNTRVGFVVGAAARLRPREATVTTDEKEIERPLDGHEQGLVLREVRRHADRADDVVGMVCHRGGYEDKKKRDGVKRFENPRP